MPIATTTTTSTAPESNASSTSCFSRTLKCEAQVEAVPIEEEEPEDPKEKLSSECRESPACASAVNALDRCAERLAESPESEEKCVEEFFKVMHCVDSCVSKKLFQHLK